MDSDKTHRRQYVTWMCLLAAAISMASSGCSLFVMAGKALFGDPKVTAEFRTVTGTDLTDGKDSVVIICTAPHRLTSELPSLQIDIVDRVTRNLETRDVRIVPSGDVASWHDDHGEWGDYSEMAKHFGAKYVIHVSLREFSHRVPESPDLLQGTAEGRISVHEVSTKKAKALTARDFKAPVALVFDRDFRLTYPKSYPIPRQTRSEDLFVHGFLDRVSQNIAQHFYDYKMSEQIH